MNSTISRLMKTYEKMSRRELIQGMALLTASAAAVEAQDIAPIEPLHEKFTGINHVSIDVSNLETSTEFYKTGIWFLHDQAQGEHHADLRERARFSGAAGREAAGQGRSCLARSL